jgi:hypothetical protein
MLLLSVFIAGPAGWLRKKCKNRTFLFPRNKFFSGVRLKSGHANKLHLPPGDVPSERRRPFIPGFNLGKRCENPEDFCLKAHAAPRFGLASLRLAASKHCEDGAYLGLSSNKKFQPQRGYGNFPCVRTTSGHLPAKRRGVQGLCNTQ